MQGIWDTLFFILLSALAGLIAFLGGRSINRKKFNEALASGQPLHLSLAEHKGAFHPWWFWSSVVVFLLVSVAASLLGSEFLHFDFDSNMLLVIAVVVGLLVLGVASIAIRRADRVPPVPAEREGERR